jgi:PPK2 family polyphosphate:nucleotide phosphotransferase
MLVKSGTKGSQNDCDPDDTGPYRSADDVEEPLTKRLADLIKLQHLLYADNRRALLIILQGMDASGKDGTIRKVMSGLNPLGVQVTPLKVPSEEELDHDFLWRIHKAVPRKGDIGIFNRSQYEDVVVVRVHKLVLARIWQARYEQINQFEKILVDNVTVILKFFLHINKDEQRDRLRERLTDPTRCWKFSQKDVEERRYWPAYRKAYEDAVTKCTTGWAPWHIVPANRKWYRNLVVAETIVQSLRTLDLKYAPPKVDLSQVVID